MHRVLYLVDDGAGLLEIVAVYLDIDRLLRAEAGHAFHQPSRIEEHRDAGEELDDCRSDGVHDLDLVAPALVGRHQIDRNDRGVRAGVGIEQGRASLRQHAGTGGDRFQFIRGDLFPKHTLDLGDLIHGFFHPLADRAAEHDPELAFVRDREKFGADEGQQQQ